MSRLDVVFDNPRGVACDQRSGGHIPGDYAGGCHDAAVPDSDAGQDDRIRADEAVVADEHVTSAPVDVVVRQDGGAECDGGVLADMNAARVRLVELRAHRNRGSFAEIHLSHATQVLPTQPENEFTHPIEYAGRYRDRQRSSSKRSEMV